MPLLKRRPKVKVVGAEGLPASRVAELEAMAMKLRMEGRPTGQLYREVGQEVHSAGHAWPRVLEDEATGTTTVPATFEGLLAIISSWDSLLLDEELVVLRNLTEKMLPMGLMKQEAVRRHRARVAEAEQHMREHHPDEWRESQGWMV